MGNGFWFDILKLVGGIIILIISGDYLVKGGVGLAKHFNVPTLVMGLTVVAFGTSAPELIVSMGAAFTHHSEIALGNVIGSNIANIALVLAITVLILPMPVAQSTIKRSWPVMMVSGVILYLAMFDNEIGHFEGMLMFGLLILFIYRSVKGNKNSDPAFNKELVVAKHSTGIYVLMVILASAGLAVGSRFLILGASGIAAEAGMSERVISLTIVAFGTSIPELTASVVAAFKKETDISVGNIIGSNIFNIYAVIGLTSTIQTIRFRFVEFQVDLLVMLGLFVLLFLFMVPFSSMIKQRNRGDLQNWWKGISGGKISRIAGLILIASYVGYLYLIL